MYIMDVNIEDLTRVLMLIEFIKQVEEKRQNARLAEHFISFTQQVNSIIQ